jgi:hypothetical protein
VGRTLQGNQSLRKYVLSCRSVLFQLPEFIPAKSMGTELPGRCPTCRNCKECQFRVDSLSLKENTVYEIILSKLKLNEQRKKWVAAYLFNTLVGKLIDNYSQREKYRHLQPKMMFFPNSTTFLKNLIEASGFL